MASEGATIVIGVREKLLKRCYSVVKQNRGMLLRGSFLSQPIVNVLAEMELTLDQLHRLSQQKAAFLHAIETFRIDARNRQLNIRRDPREPPELRIERNTEYHRIAAMLIKLESQRRETSWQFEAEERQIEYRLATLLNQYNLFTLDDGDT